MAVIEWLLRALGSIVRVASQILGIILGPLIGRFHWSAPGWMKAVARNKRAATGIALAIIVLVVAGVFGWNWYRHRPQPARMSFSVSAPAVTDYAQTDGNPPVVHALVVQFSGSAAPLENVDKRVTRGISVHPAVKGAWQWTDDHTLTFTPAADWPVGEHYEVRFNPSVLVAPQVLLDKDRFSFATAAFAASLGSGEFHQDPQDARHKQVIQELDFNYPVDAASLEKRVHMWVMQPNGERGHNVPFTITYGKQKIRVWIHSSTLPLPHDPGALEVKVDAGVASSRGGDGTASDLGNQVKIPGLYSLGVDDLHAAVAETDAHQPKQVLVLDFSGSVQASDVAKHVHAWVLPKHKDATHASQRTQAYDWSASEVSTSVLARATALPLDATPTERRWQALQSFGFHATPGQRIYVRVDKGLTSFGGYVLGKPVAEVVTVPQYPRTLRFVSTGSLLSLDGSQRIAIVSRNMPGFELEIGRVLPHQLQHLASLNEGTYGHPKLPYSFSEDQIVDRHVIKRAVTGRDPAKADYTGVSLRQYLAHGGRGVFWLHLSGYDPAAAARTQTRRAKACAEARQALARPAGAGTVPAANSVRGIAACRASGANDGRMHNAPDDDRLIVITDLGMLVKTARDGSQDVFVQSIATGRPVAGATVAVVAVNGQTLLARTTGNDGMATFPSLQGFDADKRPVMYLVTKGQDTSFLPVSAADRKLDYSRFPVGGASDAVNRGQLSGYLFSDRGLYRPGETLHAGIIVRAADWALDVAGIPLAATLTDPRGRVVKSFPLTMDRTGFNALSYAFAQTAPTGTWSLALYITRGGVAQTRIGGTTVAVKEFLPARMKVNANLSSHVADGWVKPDGLSGEVDAANLFGTPAANRRVTASMTLEPAFPEFKGWRGWHFHDIHRAKRGYEQALPDGKTDAKGHATFALDLSKYKGATYRLSFLARVHAAGSGRGVAALATAMVSSNDWLVGYHSADRLNYVPRGAARTVKLVAINPDAKSVAMSGLTLQLVERKYVSVLTKQDSGAYKYESRRKEIPVHSQPLTIPAGGKSIRLTTKQPGNFALRVLRKDGKEVNRIDYSVAGAGNVSRSLTRNAELQLTLDKHVYRPGDTIHVSIRAPYTGSGLITIERDKVYAHTWFHTTTTSSVQSITIPKDFTGNGYVNVAFVRSPSSDAIFMSPLSYGVAAFRLSRAQHRDTLTVTAPKLVKPGHDAVFHLHTAHPAKVVVFAVNEGILQVARYKFGDPLDTFFRKRMLGVSTAQILDLILPEFEKLVSGASTPGGDANAAIRRQLNPFHRKNKPPVVYWSGIVDVGSDKDFTFSVPDDFNGELRVMAMAVTPHRIGTWQGSTTVRGDFVLSPNAPTTLAPGDIADVTVGVANNLTDIGKAKVPVAVSLVTSAGLKVLGPATDKVSLASMTEGEATFRVKATATLGSADLHFTARYGTHAVNLATDVSVRPDTPYRVSIDTRRVPSGHNVDVTTLRDMYAPYAQRNAVLSSSPLVLARGLTSYLINYPNRCTEQLVSAAMPRLIVPNWPAAQGFIAALKPAFGNKPITNAAALSHFLATLQTRQNGEGGFGLWAATPTSLPFISDYAMNFLLEAQRRGVRVPRDMLDAGNQYLKQLAADDSLTSLSGLRDRAYAVYLLTAQGNVTTNDLVAVQRRLAKRYPKQWKTDLAAAWLAASYKLLKQDDEADKLIAGPLKVLERNDPTHGRFDFADYYGPAVRDASVLYLLARQFPDKAQSLSAQAVENVAWPLEHNQYNTLSAAMTLLALDTYASGHPEGLAKMKIEALTKHGAAQSIGKLGGYMWSADTWPNGTTGLRFVNPGNQHAWGVVTQSGYDVHGPAKAIKDGLEVVREYTDTKGDPITRVTLGETIEVHLKIRALGNKNLEHVAIIDLLPGGFNAVLRQGPTAAANAGDGSSAHGPQAHWTAPIGSGDSTWQPTFADVREDRVVLYGTATPNVREFTYTIRATSSGTFQIPPVFASSMYRPAVQAESPSQSTLTVVRAKP